MGNFIIIIVDGRLILRQRLVPFSHLFSIKLEEWSLHEHTMSKALLLAEQKMDEIERRSVV